MSVKNKTSGRDSGPGRQMLRRTLFMMAVCGIAAFAVLIGRLYQLMVVESPIFLKV